MPVLDIFGQGKGGLFGGGGGPSGATFGDVGGAVSDIFAAQGDEMKAQGFQLKAQGDVLEGQNYDLAAALAGQNAEFTAQSTALKQAQLDRQATMQIGAEKADVAGAGFANSGSSLDLLRDSASQAALTRAVAGQQGLITEAGYQEQQQSFQTMSKAAGIAVSEDKLAADEAKQAATGSEISAGLKGAAAIATLV